MSCIYSAVHVSHNGWGAHAGWMGCTCWMDGWGAHAGWMGCTCWMDGVHMLDGWMGCTCWMDGWGAHAGWMGCTCWMDAHAMGCTCSGNMRNWHMGGTCNACDHAMWCIRVGFESRPTCNECRFCIKERLRWPGLQWPSHCAPSCTSSCHYNDHRFGALVQPRVLLAFMPCLPPYPYP